MERAFIATKESEYYKVLMDHKANVKKQMDFVIKYLAEIGIESTKYYMHGNGVVNLPFKEWEIGNIRLSIIPTKKDEENFNKKLLKADKHGLRQFRKTSKICKEFARKCIDEKIIINTHEPRISDYFKSLEYGLFGASYTRFLRENVFYIKMEHERLKVDDTPEGFKEIKLSEYYKVLEEVENEKAN